MSDRFKYHPEQPSVAGARCPVCDWPLKLKLADGCVAGSCSYRPEQGTAEYRRIQHRRAALTDKDGR
jgi:hypothetical protein